MMNPKNTGTQAPTGVNAPVSDAMVTEMLGNNTSPVPPAPTTRPQASDDADARITQRNRLEAEFAGQDAQTQAQNAAEVFRIQLAERENQRQVDLESKTRTANFAANNANPSFGTGVRLVESLEMLYVSRAAELPQGPDRESCLWHANAMTCAKNFLSALPKFIPLLLLAMLVATSACAKLDKGADPIEVRAEQTISISVTTFDTFLQLEHQNAPLVKEKTPKVHEFAEWLRAPVLVNGQTLARDLSLAQSATQARLAYKTNRTEENKASLEAAMAALAAAVAETAKQTSQLPK